MRGVNRCALCISFGSSRLTEKQTLKQYKILAGSKLDISHLTFKAYIKHVNTTVLLLLSYLQKWLTSYFIVFRLFHNRSSYNKRLHI